MTTDNYMIGHLARETGCKIQTIRYYEQIGILPTPMRTVGNQRRYGPRHIQQLAFIRHSRQLGFSLESIRQLLSLADAPEQSCGTADQIARTQLLEVESRIERLQSLKVELNRMVEQCGGGQVTDCRVIEVLGDHAHCLHENHLAPEGTK
jgi:DNA-binding transcriptional MerR regulator